MTHDPTCTVPEAHSEEDCNGKARARAFSEELRELVAAHCPSLSAEDEDEILDRTIQSSDAADFALRTCSCGVHLDGMYAYVDHLLDEGGAEGIAGAERTTDGDEVWWQS